MQISRMLGMGPSQQLRELELKMAGAERGGLTLSQLERRVIKYHMQEGWHRRTSGTRNECGNWHLRVFGIGMDWSR